MAATRTRAAEPPTRFEDGLRERHKRRRRTRILDAVGELLRENPQAGISTERIAQRAEVAPATVYNLIGTREKIWGALASWFMDELEGRLARSHARDAEGRAREVIRRTVELFVEDPVVSRSMLRGWEESGLVLDRTPLAHLRAALEDAQTHGVLRSEVDVGALAGVVGTACLGALHQWAAGLIDDGRFRARALQALDVAVAAGAADPHRARAVGRLRGRSASRARSGRAA
jgi:AcrR family transcriptional regulator